MDSPDIQLLSQCPYSGARAELAEKIDRARVEWKQLDSTQKQMKISKRGSQHAKIL